MPWKQRGLVVLMLVVVGLVLASRVKEVVQDGLGPAKNPLKGAVYASEIPIYPGARFTDIMGGNYYEESGGPVTFTSQSWFFDLTDPVEKVIQFYQAKLPPGHHEVEGEEGSVTFEWTPPGAVDGEDVTVVIRPGQLQIGETVKTKAAN
jgi:hypothetical protein